jgi:hypothetical protein
MQASLQIKLALNAFVNRILISCYHFSRFVLCHTHSKDFLVLFRLPCYQQCLRFCPEKITSPVQTTASCVPYNFFSLRVCFETSQWYIPKQYAREMATKHVLVSKLSEKEMHQKGVRPQFFTVGAGLTLRLYRMSQEECARLRESVPYVKVYRYNPKHLYPKFNGYVDNGQRKVGSSCGSTYCTC